MTKIIECGSTTLLRITAPVQKKITRALSLLREKEWSGILFYTVREGRTKRQLTTEDILILDIGTGTHTEWDASEANLEIAGYMADNELEHCKLGLLHSHNSMAAFFSGEDMSTLRKEGMEKENFLSLIVNDSQEYTAKYTTRCTYYPTYRISYPTAKGTATKTVDGEAYMDIISEDVEIIYALREPLEEDDLLKVAYRIKENKRERVKPPKTRLIW